MFPCRPSQKNWNFSLPRWITKGWNWSIHFRLKVVCMEVSLCGTGQYLTFETFKMHMNTSHIYHIWMFTKEVATVLPCCLHMSPYFTAEWRETGIQAAPSCPRSEVVCCRWSTGSRGIRTGRCFWTLVLFLSHEISNNFRSRMWPWFLTGCRLHFDTITSSHFWHT